MLLSRIQTFLETKHTFLITLQRAAYFGCVELPRGQSRKKNSLLRTSMMQLKKKKKHVMKRQLSEGFFLRYLGFAQFKGSRKHSHYTFTVAVCFNDVSALLHSVSLVAGPEPPGRNVLFSVMFLVSCSAAVFLFSPPPTSSVSMAPPPFCISTIK